MRRGRKEEVVAYFDNLVAAHELVNVLAWPAVEKQTGEIHAAFPRLEAAFVDGGADVCGGQVGERLLVAGRVFGHELHTNVEEFATGEVDFLAGGRGDFHQAVC